MPTADLSVVKQYNRSFTEGTQTLITVSKDGSSRVLSSQTHISRESNNKTDQLKQSEEQADINYIVKTGVQLTVSNQTNKKTDKSKVLVGHPNTVKTNEISIQTSVQTLKDKTDQVQDCEVQTETIKTDECSTQTMAKDKTDYSKDCEVQTEIINTNEDGAQPVALRKTNKTDFLRDSNVQTDMATTCECCTQTTHGADLKVGNDDVRLFPLRTNSSLLRENTAQTDSKDDSLLPSMFFDFAEETCCPKLNLKDVTQTEIIGETNQSYFYDSLEEDVCPKSNLKGSATQTESSDGREKLCFYDSLEEDCHGSNLKVEKSADERLTFLHLPRPLRLFGSIHPPSPASFESPMIVLANRLGSLNVGLPMTLCFQAQSLRKKASRVEDDNESLVLQLKKMATRARSTVVHSRPYPALKHFGRFSPLPLLVWCEF